MAVARCWRPAGSRVGRISSGRGPRVAAAASGGGPGGGGGGGLILPGSDGFGELAERALAQPGGATPTFRPGGPGGFGGPGGPPGAFRPPGGGGGAAARATPAGEALGDADPLGLGPDAGKRTGAFAPYRPPSAQGANEDVASGSTEQLLMRMRVGGIRWWDMSDVIGALMKTGLSPTDIAEESGMSPREQANIMTQAYVYRSLAASPKFPKEKLEYFDRPELGVLGELRELVGDRRWQAAEYCVDSGFGQPEAAELAKAYRMLDMFPAERKGFSDAPGDVLAFKLFRNAAEVGKRFGGEEFDRMVGRAKRYAVTDTAIARVDMLREVKEGEEDSAAAPDAALVKSHLEVLRLQATEQTFRTLPVLGALAEVKPQDFRALPTAQFSGPFRVFNPGTTKYRWMAVPSWAYIQEAENLCAVFVPAVEDIGAGIQSLKSQKGPAMLLVNRTDQVYPKHYYIASKQSALLGAGGGGNLESVEIVGGGELVGAQGWTVLGRVMLAVQPPATDDEGMQAAQLVE